jgi:hypothetical protein
MTPVELIKQRKIQISVMLAIAATCIFGRLSFVATEAAFENPRPTAFEQLAWLWSLLRWSVPALLVGILDARRPIVIAALVSLISGVALLGIEFSSFVATGLPLPDSIYFEGAARELGASIAIAVVAAFCVRASYRWTAIRLTQRQSSHPYK